MFNNKSFRDMQFKNYLKEKLPFFVATSALLVLASCGSYQHAGYDNDGIYSSNTKQTQEEPPKETVANNENSGYYKNYFSEKTREYEAIAQENEIFTDIDSYQGNDAEQSSTQEVEYNSGYAGWGEADHTEVIVNINAGWNNWYRPWGFGFYNSWYGGYWNRPFWGIGFGFNDPFWCPPFYGNGFGYGYGYGYYNPYWNGGGYYYRNRGYRNYSRRGLAYNQGRRNSIYNNRLGRRSSSVNRNSTRRNSTSVMRSQTRRNNTIRNGNSTRTRTTTRTRTNTSKPRISTPRRSTPRVTTPRRSYSSPSRSSSTRSSRSYSGSRSSGTRSSGRRR